MSLLDLAIAVAAIAAIAAGWRLGFLARSLSWLGLGLGVLVAALLLPRLLAALRDSSPGSRLFATLALVIGLGALGQGIGMAVSTALHRRLQLGMLGRRGDRAAGAVVALVGVIAGLWLLLPVLANVPGWPARAARESAILRAIDERLPQPPGSLAALGNLVSDAAGPEVFHDLQPAPDVGVPPSTGLAAGVSARVAASTVRVTGEACNQIQEGSGWVVAPGVVVTNAHVVAGERRTSVQTETGLDVPATVVGFDADRDVAVLSVPRVDAPALSLGDASAGDEGAVYGHPRGGALRAAPARISEEITAVGTNIYRSGSTRRQILVLAAYLEPGDSGGVLVDLGGEVIGTAFAVDPSNSTTAYALTNDEVLAVVDAAGQGAVDTGGCLVE